MKGLIRLIILVLFIGGWCLAAGALHVVRTPERIIIIPKNSLRLNETYVDTRNWTAEDVALHPALIERMINLGKADALGHVVGTTDEMQTVAKLSDILAQGPPAHAPVEASPTLSIPGMGG